MKSLDYHYPMSGSMDRYFQNTTTRNVRSVQDYYPFGMHMPGRSFVSGEGHRYGFNGFEVDSEASENGEILEFGGFGYQTTICRRWTTDPMSDKNPSFSAYSISDCNPIVFYDNQGYYRLPKKDQKKNPQLTNLLKNISTTVHQNPIVYSAFKETLGLTDKQAKTMLQWGKGPKVRLANLGDVETYEYFGYTKDSRRIFVNMDMIDALEGRRKNPLSSEGIVFAVFATILHESQHYAEFKYGIETYEPYDPGDPEHEAGFAFEIHAFGGQIGFINPENATDELMPYATTFDNILESMGTYSFEPKEAKGKMSQWSNDSYQISKDLKVDTDVQKRD